MADATPKDERPPRVLIVDDEPANRLVIEAFLVPMGIEVTHAGDGEEALQVVAECRPDVILLDVMMPKLDGFETARRLKAHEETAIIPIVVVTSLHDVEYRVKALEAGADDFLSKPVDKTELRARVGSLVKVKAYNDSQRDRQEELRREVDRQTVELRHAYDQVKAASIDAVHRLSRAVEYRDDDTGHHVHRVAAYSMAISRQLGYDEDFVEVIGNASQMHDIGKIAVPDRVLLKPGKLDEDEWEIMRLHTVRGAEILEGSPSKLLQVAQRIAMSHHEWWDGSGYPEGLRGTDIPIEARIVAVADVFDALTSARPYKAAMDSETALAIVREQIGTHFQPEVVDAFLARLDDILVIHRDWGRPSDPPPGD